MAKRTRAVGIFAGAALIASIAVAGAAPQQAAAAAPPIQTTSSGAPATVPALATWTAGTGGFQYTEDTTVVAAAAQSDVAEQLATDLGNALDTEVGVSTSGAGTGDVQLSLDPATADELGNEGYKVTIGDTISITAATETGLYYGGQSAAQWATLAGLTKSVPAGSSTDVPQYSVRGVGICACIIQISMEKFEETIREMAYYKMNELWVEIKVESEAFPEATFWSYYTHEQAQYLTQFAAEHHVRIVAEVNSPGHMEPWIAPYPDLQLVNKSGVKQSSQLDITKPEALEVITTLADEYFEHFDTDYWHMGADEYLLGSGTLTDYPQFKEKAIEDFGPNGQEIDVFIDFINKVNAHVKSKGKQLRIWNDGLKAYNIVKLDKDIIVEHWYNYGQSPKSILAAGNDVVNADSRLYFTRNGAYNNVQNQWNAGWTPMNFGGIGVVDDSTTEGKVIGGKLTLWPDNGPGMTENTLFTQARDTMLFVAQATWGSARPVSTFAEFQSLGTALGAGPSTVSIDWAPVPAGEYVISGGSLNLTAGSPVTADAANSTWAISTTTDGYYKIASGDKCLVMRGNTDLTLNSPQKFGEKPSVETCASSGASSNLQKWWVKKVDGGYSLIHAITQLPLVVDGSAVAQQDPNHNTATAFKFIGDGVSASTSFSGRFVAGVSTKVVVTVRNLSGDAATDVVVSPEVPEGWLVSPASYNVGTLAAQESKDFTFTVTPNAGPAAQTNVKFVTDYKLAGQADSRTVSIPAVFSCSTTVTSPKEVVRVSSEQNDSNEVALATNAIDGNANTFWHTQWSPSETPHPHQLVVGLAQESEICAISLTPRQGVSSGAANGQIKDFDLYATTDRTVAAGTNPAAWGEPVLSATLPAGQSVQWVPLKAPITTQYLLLVSKTAQVATQNFTTLGEFSVDMTGADTTKPVVAAIADVTTEVGSAVSVPVKAADASALTYSASGLPSGVSIDEATGVISGTPSAAGVSTVKVTVTDAKGNATDSSFTITVTPKASPSPSASPSPEPTPTTKPTPTKSPTAKPTAKPTGKPTVKPDVPRSAPYTIPGSHVINGRTWFTTCEAYSQTERCRTDIWATVVVKTATGYEVRQGWAFNNLTYLPMMTRAQWAGNPLARTGTWTAADGRAWRTECDTAATGSNGCRSYTKATVYAALPKAGGGYRFTQQSQWVFNNIVQFR